MIEILLNAHKNKKFFIWNFKNNVEAIPENCNPNKHPRYQKFEGITVLYNEHGEMLEVMNLRETSRKVLSLFGIEYEKMYCVNM